MLPIGIVIPTRNSAKALRKQIGSLRAVVEHVTQVVVVDSSEDETLDLLQTELRGLGVRFLKHPPGLYQSWNFGISQLTTPYTYISTVGDSIDRKGLEHLYETITRFDADLVVSPPEFVDESGLPVTGKSWPIHALLKRRAINEPLVLSPCEVFVLQVLEVPKALIGSSASNLYKTEMLQRFPFPAEYGHFGDVAWGIQHAFETKLAITPVVVSKFVVEEKGKTTPIETIERERAKLLALATERMGNVGCSPSVKSMLARLPQTTAAAWESQQAYDAFRRASLPWFLKPAAWKARHARKSHKKDLATLRGNLLREASSDLAHPKLS